MIFSLLLSNGVIQVKDLVYSESYSQEEDRARMAR